MPDYDEYYLSKLRVYVHFVPYEPLAAILLAYRIPAAPSVACSELFPLASAIFLPIGRSVAKHSSANKLETLMD